MSSLAGDFFQLRLRGLSPVGLTRFATEVVKSGKSAEVVSFAWWELLHRSGLQRSITFTDDQPAILAGGSDLELSRNSEQRSHRFVEADVPWLMAFRISGSEYGTLFDEPETLYVRRPQPKVSQATEDSAPSPVWTFEYPIRSIFVTDAETVVVSTGNGEVHRFDPPSGNCRLVQRLSSTESYLRFDCCITETDDKILAMAEYGNVKKQGRWQSVAYLYFSIDDGLTWSVSDVLIEAGINKHSHFIRYSAKTGTVFLSVGDNKKQLLEGQLEIKDGEVVATWNRRNRWHIQTGGYTSITETEDRLLFGSDYHHGTNFIVVSDDGNEFSKSSIPDPYRRSPVFGMTKRTVGANTEIWANLYNSVSSRSRSLLMMSEDGGLTWRRIIDYDGTANRIYLASGGDVPIEDSRLLIHVTAVTDVVDEQPVATFEVVDAADTTRSESAFVTEGSV